MPSRTGGRNVASKWVRVVALLAMTMIAVGLAKETGSAAVGSPNPEASRLKPDGAVTAASHLGPEVAVCCNDEKDQARTAVTYNRAHGEYLAVYHNEYTNERYIAGARVTKSGDGFSTFLISAIGSYDCCLYPAVALNRWNDEYLVVWQQYNADQNKWEIYGRFIPWDGLDFSIAPFQIAQWSSMNLKFPAVAWNSYRNEYLVVWQTEDLTGQLLGIGRRRLGANGSFLSNADYITQSGFPGSPDITYNVAADQYLAVWAQIGSSFIDIYGGRLNREGALQGSVFAINEAADEQQLPSVTTNEQNRYLVVWQDKRYGDWDVAGQLLDADGNKVGGDVWVTLSTDDDTHPDVVANGPTQQYLTVWQRGTPSGEAIEAGLLDADGTIVDAFELAPGGFGDNATPAVGSHQAGYYVVYDWSSWTPGSNSDIFGRTWTPFAHFLPFFIR